MKESKAGCIPISTPLQSRQDVEVMMEGWRRIMLGSNNYLGLTTAPMWWRRHPCPEQYGTGCSGPGSSTAPPDAGLELEEELGKFLRKPGIVTFGTGVPVQRGYHQRTGGAGSTTM